MEITHWVSEGTPDKESVERAFDAGFRGLDCTRPPLPSHIAEMACRVGLQAASERGERDYIEIRFILDESGIPRYEWVERPSDS